MRTWRQPGPFVVVPTESPHYEKNSSLVRNGKEMSVKVRYNVTTMWKLNGSDGHEIQRGCQAELAVY